MEHSGIGITIIGSGSATPEGVFDNQGLKSGTGIRTRCLASISETLSAFATQAAEEAIAIAGFSVLARVALAAR